MMRNPGLKCIESPHKMPLGSIAKDFILKRRSILYSYPQMQVYQNQISITYETVYGDDKEPPFNFLEDLKGIMDGLTNKMRIYKINRLESFSINFIACKYIPSESFRYLKQNLMKYLPKLKRLALNFYNAETTSDQGIEAISGLILSFKNLESLQIRFIGSECGEKGHLDYLIKKVQKSHRFMKNLQIETSSTFRREYDYMQFLKRDFFQELNYNTSSAIFSCSDEGISQNCALKTFRIITNRYQGLQSLNLMFQWMKEITDQLCLQLGKGILEKMECLKYLNLNFLGCGSITNDAMALFNSTPPSKRKPRALEHLTLNFLRIATINGVGLKTLGEGISQQFKDLNKLVLGFDLGGEVNDDGLGEFNAMITSNLKSLKSYTLTDGLRPNQKRNAKKMSQDIFENLKELKELCLLHPERTAGHELLAISSELENQKNQQELEKLHLFKINAKEAEISKFFKIWNTTTLKNLIELKLDSNWNGDFNDQVVADLGKALETMTKLKRLALLLHKCFNIGRSPNSNLTVLIPKASILETYELDLGSCHDIADQLVDEFGASLCQHQKELTLLYLCFCQCPNITEKTFQKLCYGIKHDMKGMQHLTLNFEWNSNISTKIRHEMKGHFKVIPAVALY